MDLFGCTIGFDGGLTYNNTAYFKVVSFSSLSFSFASFSVVEENVYFLVTTGRIASTSVYLTRKILIPSNDLDELELT